MSHDADALPPQLVDDMRPDKAGGASDKGSIHGT